MSKEQKFFFCKHCKNLTASLFSSGIPMVCCGEVMKEIIPNSVDAAVEKHKPVVTITSDGNISVNIGEAPHPMIEEHYIEWIFIETSKGGSFKYLKPNEKPFAEFIILPDEQIIKVYSYCNIHGLWVNVI